VRCAGETPLRCHAALTSVKQCGYVAKRTRTTGQTRCTKNFCGTNFAIGLCVEVKARVVSDANLGVVELSSAAAAALPVAGLKDHAATRVGLWPMTVWQVRKGAGAFLRAALANRS